MTRTDVIGRLQNVFREFFGDDSLVLEEVTTAEDVADWDSLANVELMVEIEEHFGVRFRTGQVAELANIGQLVDVILADAGAE